MLYMETGGRVFRSWEAEILLSLGRYSVCITWGIYYCDWKDKHVAYCSQNMEGFE